MPRLSLSWAAWATSAEVRGQQEGDKRRFSSSESLPNFASSNHKSQRQHAAANSGAARRCSRLPTSCSRLPQRSRHSYPGQNPEPRPGTGGRPAFLHRLGARPHAHTHIDSVSSGVAQAALRCSRLLPTMLLVTAGARTSFFPAAVSITGQTLAPGLRRRSGAAACRGSTPALPRSLRHPLEHRRHREDRANPARGERPGANWR